MRISDLGGEERPDLSTFLSDEDFADPDSVIDDDPETWMDDADAMPRGGEIDDGSSKLRGKAVEVFVPKPDKTEYRHNPILKRRVRDGGRTKSQVDFENEQRRHGVRRKDGRRKRPGTQ